MKFQAIVALLFTAWFGSLFAQKTIKSVKINQTEIIADDFLGFDCFGFEYKIVNNILQKAKKQEHFEYKNISLGKITKADFLNPLKVVLFYENFNTAILIDNQFNEVKTINFSNNDTSIAVSKIGMAFQNQLWVFNTLTQQIGLFDYLKNEYKTISTPISESLKHYQTNFNTFFWIDLNNNLYSCDLFGKIKFLCKAPEFDTIYIINNHQYIYSLNNQLYFTDIRKNDFKMGIPIEISEKTFKNYYYKDQILSIFTTQKIINYKIILP